MIGDMDLVGFSGIYIFELGCVWWFNQQRLMGSFSWGYNWYNQQRIEGPL